MWKKKNCTEDLSDPRKLILSSDTRERFPHLPLVVHGADVHRYQRADVRGDELKARPKRVPS